MASRMRFKEIPIDQIEKNNENPRSAFDEEKIDELATSIRSMGVLVPVTLYEKGEDKYVLLDGERRWRAAKRINLPKIPAWISQDPGFVKNIETMFHIHMERVEWSNIDKVQALQKLMRGSGTSDPEQLEKMTGVSQSTILEWNRILAQPEEYRELIYNGSLPFNFFTELNDRVIEPLKKERPSVFKKLGEKKIAKLFVERRKGGHLENVTGLFRQVNTIIHKAKDETVNGKDSPHDKTLERVITDVEYPIQEAYEDVTGSAVETEKCIKQCGRLGDRLKALVKETLSPREKRGLLRMLEQLLKTIGKAIESLRK